MLSLHLWEEKIVYYIAFLKKIASMTLLDINIFAIKSLASV